MKPEQKTVFIKISEKSFFLFNLSVICNDILISKVRKETP